MKTSKGFAHTHTILVTLAVLIVIGLAYYLGKNDSKITSPISDSYEPVKVEQNNSQNNNYVPVVPKTPMSTVLPQYVGGQEGWPPVIKDSNKSYTCDNLGQGPVGEVKVEKVINSRTYCVVSTFEAAAGSRYGVYLYITANGTGTKSTTFTLKWPSCGVYGGPTDETYQMCQNNQDTFFANLDSIVDSLM